MRVIKRAAAAQQVVKECTYCASELEIERSDCTFRRDDSYKHESYWECACPVCDKRIFVYNQAWDSAPPDRVDATAYLDK